jgi:hypothetical protein
MSTSPSTPRPTEPGCDPVRLASYLSLGVTGALMATATGDAAIVMIDLTNVNGQNITGANAGVSAGNKRMISSWLGVGTGTLELYNNRQSINNETYWGMDGDNGLQFAVNGTSSSRASPRNFGAGATIDGSATWTGSANRTAFRYDNNGSGQYVSPDFGAGSFMGFRFGTSGNYYFGYFEVTWNSSTLTFQILSGAYESTVNTAILAGATPPSGVPVPAASLLALMALGGNSFRRSRTRAA